MGFVGCSPGHYKRRSDGSKSVDHFFWLVDVKDKHKFALEGDTSLFPEHLDDPQKTLSLGRIRVVRVLIGL